MKTYDQIISEVAMIASKNCPNLQYHNFEHALDVFYAARDYSFLNEFSDEERFLVETSALLHDVVYVQNGKDNEEKSAEFAERYLPKLGFKKNQVKIVKSLILATKWPTNPKNQLEEVICDSDLDNLGRQDFFEKSHELMLELGIKEGKEGYLRQLKFLENNHYYNYWAKKLRNPGKDRNTQKLKQILKYYELNDSINLKGGVKCK
jgi:predicted metal-dependent HD superfamily phosphohydrolase